MMNTVFTRLQTPRLRRFGLSPQRLAWLGSFWIRNKQQRRQQRKAILNTIASRIKLGITYSLFDGEELLEASLKSVRSSAHYINVVYQTHSWYGEPTQSPLLAIVQGLQQQGLIDEIILYQPNLAINAHENEITKRNIGVEAVKKSTCDYLLIMDVDEFYLEKEITYAKEQMIEHDYESTFVFHRLYYLKPENQLKALPTYGIPFIFELRRNRKLVSKDRRPLLVDSTRCLNHIQRPYLFMVDQVVCHHMSLVRRDLLKKYRNSSASQNEKGALATTDELGETLAQQLALLENPENFNVVENVFNLVL